MCLMRDHTALRSDLRTYGLALTAWLTSLYGTLASESGIRRGEKILELILSTHIPAPWDVFVYVVANRFAPPPHLTQLKVKKVGC